jgi:hypothetical protein
VRVVSRGDRAGQGECKIRGVHNGSQTRNRALVARFRITVCTFQYYNLEQPRV